MLKNNKGFSLVELLVAFAITAIAGVALMSFIGISFFDFKKNSNEINVQYESQLAENQIENMVLSATNGVYFDDVNKKLSLYTFDFATKTKKNKMIYLDKADTDATGKLYLTEQDYDETVKADGTDVGWTDTSSELFANYISDFDVKIYDKEGNIVTPSSATDADRVELTLSYIADDRTYAETANITLRNQVVISSDTAKVFESVAAQTKEKVRLVNITPASDKANYLWVDGTYGGVFNTNIVGSNISDFTFTWALGNPAPSSSDTKVDSASGSLTIANDEKNNFQVIGTSNAATSLGVSKSGSVVIYPKYITNAAIVSVDDTDYENRQAEIVFSVTVHNGTGSEQSKIEEILTSDGNEPKVLDANGNVKSGLSGFTCTSKQLGTDECTYFFTQTFQGTSKDVDESFKYVLTCKGKGYDGTATANFKIHKQFTYGTFVLYNDVTSPQASSYTVFPGEKVQFTAAMELVYHESENDTEKKETEFSDISASKVDWSYSITGGLTKSAYVDDFDSSNGNITIKSNLTLPDNMDSVEVIVKAKYKDSEGTEHEASNSLQIVPVNLIVKTGQYYSTGQVLFTDANVQTKEIITANDQKAAYTLYFYAQNLNGSNIKSYDLEGSCTVSEISVSTGTAKNTNNKELGKEYKLSTIKASLIGGKWNDQTVEEGTLKYKITVHARKYDREGNEVGDGARSFHTMTKTIPVLVANANVFTGAIWDSDYLFEASPMKYDRAIDEDMGIFAPSAFYRYGPSTANTATSNVTLYTLYNDLTGTKELQWVGVNLGKNTMKLDGNKYKEGTVSTDDGNITGWFN